MNKSDASCNVGVTVIGDCSLGVGDGGRRILVAVKLCTTSNWWLADLGT